MKIGLDVLGGDFAPKVTLEGAIMAQKELPESDKIVLIGGKEVIVPFLKKEKVNPALFEIIDAPDLIEMGEQPTKALTAKPNSSISVGFKLLKHKEIQSFSSAGSSGAMLVGSIYSVNTVQGVIRPATTAYIPKESGGFTVLIDVGTNPDAKPDVMYQFGILGSLFAEHVFHVKKPRVGLLNIGTEEKKGSLTAQSTFELMKDSKDFHFIGNIEGRELFRDNVDVIVCDGFVGNIVLKQVEAMYRVLTKRGIKDSFLDRFNYENYGGTPILGINSTVLVGHGISNANAVRRMILMSKEVHEARLSQKIKQALECCSLNNL
ncbi:MAG: phosphate acyltransferase PlsX [Bacteroidales bacterium]|nr:phosphate acyltransferase PlsX [Bacteroidales bacterium]MDD4602538.1 phosphate acyltransferase PlsX [Bacteroidales bacterium]